MAEKEIVLIMGYPASGKTSLVSDYKGYCRLNRDVLGGTMAKLARVLEQRIEAGAEKFVLDNTYPTVASRKPFIDIAKRHGFLINCVYLKTSIEDAQLNASLRMIRRYGRILDLDEIEEFGKKDPNCFGAAVLFYYRKSLEEPTLAEGFDKVKPVKFRRRWDDDYQNKALILDYDGTLRDTKSGSKFPEDLDDIEILPNTREVLQEYVDQGYILCGVSNQSWIGSGKRTWDQVNDGLEHTNKLLGFEIDFRFCKHKVPPISCHCRKPQTGLGAELVEKYKLDPAQCIYVGDRTTDKTFAKRCGFKFEHADKFFRRNG